ncbi:MAG: alpha/beta hydrolase [Anaerolineales bacterium]|nr:alpha/beta hydrolase [Anaerolineales bacterium]
MRTNSLMAKAEFGEDEFAKVDGYRLHYVEAGKGPPVILISGSFSTYRAWNPILPILAKESRVLALDYLGAGDSDKPRSGFRYSIGEQADVIAKLIRTLRLGRTHLVGASYGGAIVFNLAARHPDVCGKIVSIEGGIIRPKALPGSPMEKWLGYPILGDLVIGLIRAGLVNRLALQVIAGDWLPQMTGAERRRALDEISFNARSATRHAWYWIGKSPQTLVPFEEEAKRITAPILYLAGKKSDFREMTAETIRFLDTHLPHAKILNYTDGIHDLQSQKPYEVAKAIREFLASESGPA